MSPTESSEGRASDRGLEPGPRPTEPNQEQTSHQALEPTPRPTEPNQEQAIEQGLKPAPRPTQPREERSDAELLAAHVAGDAEAFGELFARHRDRLWAVALRTMGNPHDAEDGLQDALVAAFRRAGSFRGDAAVTTWLHRVVVNACLDRLRAAKVRATQPLPQDLAEGNDWQPATIGADQGPQPTPEESVVARERREAVLAALAALPAEQRAALVLVDMEGYSVAEAADILDCAVGTVKSRCSRGRRTLAVTLGRFRPGAETAGNQPEADHVPFSESGRGPPDIKS